MAIGRSRLSPRVGGGGRQLSLTLICQSGCALKSDANGHRVLCERRGSPIGRRRLSTLTRPLQVRRGRKMDN